MATMVKEKPRAKKKTKQKEVTTPEVVSEVPSAVDLAVPTEGEPSIQSYTSQDVTEDSSSNASFSQELAASSITTVTLNDTLLEAAQSIEICSPLVNETSETEKQKVSMEETVNMSQSETVIQSQGAYKEVCRKLDIISFKDVPTSSSVPVEELESKLESSTAYLRESNVAAETPSLENVPDVSVVENATPSAPMFEESLVTEMPDEAQEVLEEIRPKVQCMPLEVAMQIYGGKEMAEVRAMNEREEAIVQAGSLAGPDHPLVDLLSTFRCSLTARDQERHKVNQGYSAEEKSRAALWKVERRELSESEKCPCGSTVWFKAKYDHADLMKSKLPAAQLRLEALLKDIQESYCHHQHAALLAYYQIGELISETLQAGKGEIRSALALVLQELRMSGCAPAAFCAALRRWARALAAALLDARDPRQLLFLLQHLFRQSRSVGWVAPLLRVPMCDGSDTARALATLDLLLAGPALFVARECTEENEELWEELDKHGSGGAVSEGALREKDLLALIRAFPLRALVARLVLLPRADITQTRPYEWQYSAREVLRALCGVRTLLATLQRAALTHAHYPRLRAACLALAQPALHAASALHAHNRDSYPKDIEMQIEAELEALFLAGMALCGADGPRPPASLLRAAARAQYCAALTTHLHEKSPLLIEHLSLEVPAAPCAATVRVVAQAAIDCEDHELARIVLDFLSQTALNRKSPKCNGTCDIAARECLPRLLCAHEYLYGIALHTVARLHRADSAQASTATLQLLALQRWRPAPGEMRAVLDDWVQRCPQLLPQLLQELSYTPHDGLSLETQLAIGAWLCARPAPVPEWAWSVLTRLRVHRSSWQLPLDAPSPDNTSGVFAEAYAVLSSSWGHSVPLICSYGVPALCRVAAARAPVAAHALPLVMAAMTHSPESVSLTPQFAELVTSLLAPSQSIVQWAWGERATAPEILLRRMLVQVEAHSGPYRDALGSAWLNALCHAGLPGPRLSACDLALLAARRHNTLQELPKPEFLNHLVRNAQHAPLSCWASLHAAHAHREHSTQLFAKLLQALAAQRAKGQKTHVDNALKQIGSAMGSEELVIYRSAAAVLVAPCTNPGHLSLWTLLMQLYLHTVTNVPDTPIGTLFFSGLIKSRTLAQLKKRLNETIEHHNNQIEVIKTRLNTRPDPKPGPIRSERIKSTTPDSLILPETSGGDFVGESNDSSGSDGDDSGGDESQDCDEESASESEEKRRVNTNMMKYHEAAEKMLREYLSWLEAGERLRASPHHADIARFIPEPAMNTAWSEYLNSLRPAPSTEDDDLRPPKEPPAPKQPPTPLQTAAKWILKIRDRSDRRPHVPVITSPVEDVTFSNNRQLYSLVDKHLADIETFAKNWSADVNRVRTVDSKLWPLVSAMRVPVRLSSVRRTCPNKCPQPVFISLQHYYEWRISDGAVSGIKDNRTLAREAIRNLCRARPRAAITVAALNTIVRRIRSLEAAVGVASRAWVCAGAVGDCAPAHAALAGLLEELADRWLCIDEETVLRLISHWASGGAGAQPLLCGALLARAANTNHPRLYAALLAALCRGGQCPQRAFSYLSKFDVSRCTVAPEQRGAMLSALAAAAQHWGRAPRRDLLVLLELIGVHTATLVTPEHMPLVVLTNARAAAAGRVPPAHLEHVARACACAPRVSFDQLGNLLRELGALWWEARAELRTTNATYHIDYAPYVAALQATLQRAFVAAGLALSYAPERVCWYAWAALQESWAAWVAPHPALPPLLPSAGSDPHYTDMARRFVDNINQMMLDCPGCEEHLLSRVWEWAVQTYLSVSRSPPAHDSRVQCTDLLAELAALPWHSWQWARVACLPAAIQISTTDDVVMQSWVADTLTGIEAATWLRDVADCDLAPTLGALLRLYAGSLRLSVATLEQAAHLPWRRLPEAALDEALQRFFMEHHNPLLPYHDAVQFRVILAASGLSPPLEGARSMRACAVSHWTRAASAPALQAHVAAHARALLAIISALEPYLDESSDELEEQLSRAVVLMCMEHAAAAALPVWEQWVSNASQRMAAACAVAARALTALEYFAPLADAAVAAYMKKASGSWTEIGARLRGGAWSEPQALLARARLHAAYALAQDAQASFNAVNINFVENELIISVWICALCRAASHGAEAARAQLCKWAESPRLAILRAVICSVDWPTDRHRLLCRLALCIITPGSEPLIKAYQTFYPGVLGADTEAISWSLAPNVTHLPRLAIKLFPTAENYFEEELKIAAAL